MIKNFFSQIVIEFKKVIRWVIDEIELSATILPLTTFFIFLVAINKLIFFLFPKLAHISFFDDISNLILNMITLIIAMVFNNLGFIFFIGLSAIISIVVNFLYRTKKRSRLPVIGIPNKDNVTVLLSLFKIRCLEIAKIYSVVRRLQEEVKDGNWIELYLTEYFDLHNNSWDYDDKKRELKAQQNKEKIEILLKENFDFFQHWDNELEIKQKNLLIAFKLDHVIHNTRPLYAMQTYGVLKNTISSLIDEYNKFNSRATEIFIYNKPFFKFLKYKILNSNDVINEIWDEIIFSLESALIFLKSQNDTYFNIEEILKEVYALKYIQKELSIREVMRQKNIKKKYKYLEEQENIIMDQIKNNPFKEFC